MLNLLILKNNLIFFISVIIIAVISCVNIIDKSDDDNINELKKITWKADTLPLCWEKPESMPDGVQVGSYEVFFRNHLDSIAGWKLVRSGSVSIVQPELVVYHSEVGTGEFDFAVRAVFSDGQKSDFHTCLDSNASPKGPWYLSWQ